MAASASEARLTGNYFIGSTVGNSLLLSSGGTIQVLGSLTATNAIATINAPLIIQGGGGTYTFANDSANGSGAGAGTLNFGGGIDSKPRIRSAHHEQRFDVRL